jgi:hypothetical protein
MTKCFEPEDGDLHQVLWEALKPDSTPFYPESAQAPTCGPLTSSSLSSSRLNYISCQPQRLPGTPPPRNVRWWRRRCASWWACWGPRPRRESPGPGYLAPRPRSQDPPPPDAFPGQGLHCRGRTSWCPHGSQSQAAQLHQGDGAGEIQPGKEAVS